MPNEAIKPADVHSYPPRTISHGFKAGNTVYTAGQVALDHDGNLAGKGDSSAQADQVFSNLQAVLRAAGASMQDVVKLNIYLTGQADLTKVREVRERYFTGEFPAATGVFVSALADPDFLIEIDAIAVIS